jgi:heme exporter protein C
MRTRLLGAAAAAGLALTAVLGFTLPPTSAQGDSVAILAIHPAVAWLAYLAFGVTALASLLYLWPRTRSRFWDLVAGASAEIGVVFTGITLVMGAIWGRATWGVWWVWDARLTTTAFLFALYLGYLALRRVPDDIEVRSRRSAVAALVAVVGVPLTHFSVEWWRTLHQGRSLLRADPQLDSQYTVAILVGILAFTLLYAWLLVHRVRVEQLEERLEERALSVALQERRAEAVAS